MILNLTKILCLNTVLYVRLYGGNRNLSVFNCFLRRNSSIESLKKKLTNNNKNLNNSIFYNNRFVRAISNQTTSDEKFSGENFSSKSSSSSSIVEPSAYAKTTPEIIIENLNEGIVELQLNRLQGKNSLNKKILFEVLYLFFI